MALPWWYILLVGGLCTIWDGVVSWCLGLSFWWMLVLVPVSVGVGMCGAMRDDA